MEAYNDKDDKNNWNTSKIEINFQFIPHFFIIKKHGYLFLIIIEKRSEIPTENPDLPKLIYKNNLLGYQKA